MMQVNTETVSSSMGTATLTHCASRLAIRCRGQQDCHGCWSPPNNDPLPRPQKRLTVAEHDGAIKRCCPLAHDT